MRALLNLRAVVASSRKNLVLVNRASSGEKAQAEL
jgi:hypothetical protein